MEGREDWAAFYAGQSLVPLAIASKTVGVLEKEQIWLRSGEIYNFLKIEGKACGLVTPILPTTYYSM
jgi:hypothetical protein